MIRERHQTVTNQPQAAGFFMRSVNEMVLIVVSVLITGCSPNTPNLDPIPQPPKTTVRRDLFRGASRAIREIQSTAIVSDADSLGEFKKSLRSLSTELLVIRDANPTDDETVVYDAFLEAFEIYQDVDTLNDFSVSNWVQLTNIRRELAELKRKSYSDESRLVIAHKEFIRMVSEGGIPVRGSHASDNTFFEKLSGMDEAQQIAKTRRLETVNAFTAEWLTFEGRKRLWQIAGDQAENAIGLSRK